MKKHLFVIDLSNVIFRSFYGIPPLSTKKGIPTNAIKGFLNYLVKIKLQYKPTHILLAKDSSVSPIRKEIYPEYKANRSKKPEELTTQFKLIEELIGILNLPSIECERYEADDIIGSIATQWNNDFDLITIVSTDKDLMQFVTEQIVQLDLYKEKTYTALDVNTKFEVNPEFILDYLALVGDSADNIPGVTGIGPKSATKIINEFGGLDDIYKNIDKLKPAQIKHLTRDKANAYLSRKLATIYIDLDLKKDPKDTEFKVSIDEDVENFLQKLEMKASLEKLKKIND